jgi:hypothetical protein
VAKRSEMVRNGGREAPRCRLEGRDGSGGSDGLENNARRGKTEDA